VEYLSGKVQAVPTRSTDTSVYTARIILEMALRSGYGILAMMLCFMYHDLKFTRTFFKAFTRRRYIGCSLIVGLAFP
jgi:hypothetical protein